MGRPHNTSRCTEILFHRAIDESEHIHIKLQGTLPDFSVANDELCTAVRANGFLQGPPEDGLVDSA
eukprot:CAMPEP_0170636962 /NCGR_PEP_ID=MMETSP0224-20130122/38127_1 /TAXON_ID=285029 /ORGANISM="Togula jolla, Strain CCCM 725" /LENGTH=65 /DNA_ID=CAMNT_0010966749 /DNA_START=400 /DNA_END=597 /DNA_ORIENTATION=-